MRAGKKAQIRGRSQMARANHRRKADNFKRSEQRIDECLDESLKETFPASDPPSWTVLQRIGRPR